MFKDEGEVMMIESGIGKIRGIQQISTDEGIFAICAIDHRGSLKRMIEKGLSIKVDYSDMVAVKMELCAIAAHYSSAVLLDPNYGAAQCITSSVLPGNIGLLVSVEATGYESGPGGRITSLLDGWSVEKIKRMGASAVKILVYFRPDLGDITRTQLGLVQNIAEECRAYDIPFLVEPVSYPADAQKAGSAEFAAEKPGLVIENARLITMLPIDVLKSEFPADMNYEKDEGKLMEICLKLNEASRVPWVLLSAGVDYDTFCTQVAIACQAGASGFVGGRAIWQDALQIKDAKERVNFLNTTVANRLQGLVEIAAKYAVPWYRKLGVKESALALIGEGWYKSY
jgi:tagatose 1,6-diphosphate aldolase